MQAILMIGPQASGKSSFCRELLFASHVRLNLDMLKTRHREALMVAACIKAKQPFVVDNTNPTKADRARYLPALKAAGFSVTAYIFDEPYEVCSARNAARTGAARIPEAGLKHYFAKYERPQLDEGFDTLMRVRLQDGSFVVEPFSDEI
jgi:predicted kinase